MQLSLTQQQEIYDNGFVRIPGVVPRVLVDAALRAINYSLGEGMDKSDIPILRAQSYCPEVRNTPVIADLFNRSPLAMLAESLIGEGQVRPVLNGQIALRFPAMQDITPVARPHIDGTYSPNNGVKKGSIGNFTMLAGVLLSDLPEPNAGNFTVWPGTHHKFEQYFQQHGAETFADGMPQIDMPPPHQITGRAGDVIFCHHLVAHGITPNISPHIRYAIFFRLRHHDHDSHPGETLTNIWIDYRELRLDELQQPVIPMPVS